MNTNNIGKETRQKQIGAWLQAVKKNTDLLLAFPIEPVENDGLAEFRQSVADKIGWLAEYLARNEWNFFASTDIGTPLQVRIEREAVETITQAANAEITAAERAEEPHDDKEDAERAAAMDAATEAEAADFVPQSEPMVGPIPKRVFDECYQDLERRKAEAAKKKPRKRSRKADKAEGPESGVSAAEIEAAEEAAVAMARIDSEG